VPRTIEWKYGVCQALGWPQGNQADIATAWVRIRGSVRDWTDLEPELIGRVEELIDFVTQSVCGHLMVTLKESTERPTPPFQGSKPAWTLIRYHSSVTRAST